MSLGPTRAHLPLCPKRSGLDRPRLRALASGVDQRGLAVPKYDDHRFCGGDLRGGEIIAVDSATGEWQFNFPVEPAALASRRAPAQPRAGVATVSSVYAEQRPLVVSAAGAPGAPWLPGPRNRQGVRGHGGVPAAGGVLRRGDEKQRASAGAGAGRAGERRCAGRLLRGICRGVGSLVTHSPHTRPRASAATAGLAGKECCVDDCLLGPFAGGPRAPGGCEGVRPGD